MIKERPILFKGEMVRAILDGRKTMTRRIAKSGKCAFGKVGDRLWVRESFLIKPNGEFYYKADDPICNGWNDNGKSISWKPSIHMPREASRITLEITGVRIERLKDITEDDARAEGVEIFRNYRKDSQHWMNSARDSFMTLWQSIHGDETWDFDPFVWVVEFRRVK